MNAQFLGDGEDDATLGRSVELGQRESGDSIDLHRIAQGHESEPAAAEPEAATEPEQPESSAAAEAEAPAPAAAAAAPRTTHLREQALRPIKKQQSNAIS